MSDWERGNIKYKTYVDDYGDEFYVSEYGVVLTLLDLEILIAKGIGYLFNRVIPIVLDIFTDEQILNTVAKISLGKRRQILSEQSHE